jgi:hypothetical protein
VKFDPEDDFAHWRFTGWVVVACLIGAACVVVYGIANAAPTGYIIEVDGEPHVVLNQEAQQKIVEQIDGLREEIKRLKKGCPQT